MTNSYTVTRHKYGVVVEGLVPLADYGALLRAWAGDGYDILDVGIAWHFGVNIVVTSKADSARWRAEIAEKLATKYPDDKPMQWLHGCNVGASSCYLFALICDEQHRQHARIMLSRFTTDFGRDDPFPRDSDDWWRCVRMLDVCGWWDRVDAVKEKLRPEWARWWEVTP